VNDVLLIDGDFNHRAVAWRDPPGDPPIGRAKMVHARETLEHPSARCCRVRSASAPRRRRAGDRSTDFLEDQRDPRNAAPQGHGLALVIRDDVAGISCVRAYARALDVTLDNSMTLLMTAAMTRHASGGNITRIDLTL